VLEALRAFGAEPEDRGNAALVSLRGISLTYELRPGERGAPNRTICSALLPVATPAFELELRPQTEKEVRDIEKGRALDLELGDSAFDDSFVIEAAPTQMARDLLDAPLRAAFLQLFPCRLTLAGRELRFEKIDFVRRPPEVRRLTETLLNLGARLVALQGEPTQRDEPAADSPHEAQPTASAAEVEIAALHAARARRRAFRKREFAIAVVAGAVLGLVAYRLATCAPPGTH
jgi:hypothetical protein